MIRTIPPAEEVLLFAWLLLSFHDGAGPIESQAARFSYNHTLAPDCSARGISEILDGISKNLEISNLTQVDFT